VLFGNTYLVAVTDVIEAGKELDKTFVLGAG
jgi:hypothetical protein